MKKRIVVLGIIFLLIFSISASFGVEVRVSLKLNDQYIESDEPNILIDDTTYLVARSLVSTLGYTIDWNNEERKVSIITDEKKIEFSVDEDLLYVNGTAVETEKKPFIRNGRTYLPLRIVAEHLGCNIDFNQNTYTVLLTEETVEEVPEEFTYTPKYTEEDLKWLSKIVEVESDNNDLEMMLAIANVVNNRVEDPRFPNTVKDVIFEVNSHVQFPPAHKDSFEGIEPSLYSKIASKNALEGKNNIGNALFFNNQPFRSKSDDLIEIINGEYFYE
jgi:N-acetylmuramoyl-L-alanine amidase